MGEADKYLDAFRSTLPVLIDREMTKVRKQQRGLIGMVCILLITNLLLLGGVMWVLTRSKAEVPVATEMPVVAEDVADVADVPEAEKETVVFIKETLETSDAPDIPAEPAAAPETKESDRLTAAAERAAELAVRRSRAEERVRQADAVAKQQEKKSLPIPDYILTERGMTLRSLARRYYGNEVFWVCIYDRNMEVLSSPDILPQGIRLKLPRPADYGIDANDPSSLQRARKLGRSLNNIE